MRIPTDREAVLLRLIEIMEAHAPYLGAATERGALADKWLETAPTALRVRDELREELNATEGPTT